MDVLNIFKILIQQKRLSFFVCVVVIIAYNLAYGATFKRSETSKQIPKTHLMVLLDTSLTMDKVDSSDCQVVSCPQSK